MPEIHTTPTPEQPQEQLSPADIFPTPTPAFGPAHHVAAVLAHNSLVRNFPGELSNSRAAVEVAPQATTLMPEQRVPGKHAAETVLPEKRQNLGRYMAQRVLHKLGINR